MNFQELPSQYDHAAAQAKWYPFWEERGYFHAEANDQRPAYSIVIPPPNVTGALHLGHALNNTLQDILIRMKRMQGFCTLWMPGTDHAGIATQAVVERRLLEEKGETRHTLGREGLVKRIWEWKEQYEARILGQLKQMGCSCDWQRTRFTLDDTCARAVRETFFQLFKDGKIYRGKRLVNWDTFLQTAVSDDEVFHETVKGHFWHIKYPFVDSKPGEPDHVVVATTRPETMLGDTAVAVHPDPAAAFDKVETELREKFLAATAKEKGELEEQMTLLLERRAKVLPQLEKLRDMAKAGRELRLPLTNWTISLITDEWAKPEMGSGCVKITPGHDPNDYEVGERHPELGYYEPKNIMNPDGTLNEHVPERYRGLKMHTTAREKIVTDLESAGLLVEVEDREIDLAHSDRSKTPIEPYLADQWFMKMDELSQSAMDAVTSGQVKIIPERYAKGYLDWLSEKRDWPIGRQLWWGHQIPIWTRFFSPSPEERLDSIRPQAVRELASILLGKKLHTSTTVSFEEDAFEIGTIFVDGEVVPGVRYRFSDSHELSEFQEQLLVCIDPSFSEYEKRLVDARFVQVPDVLDTWFSSALWPHSTLGWPQETPELAKFYPTSALVTSRDIITLWVARMVLTGLYNMGDVPFHEVYIHPKILDGYGESMSKSKGNGVDPLDVIEKFGADALRFGLAYLTTETQDVRLPVEFECPHCGTLINQTKKNRQLPRIECDKCGKAFRTQWAEKPEDKALPRGPVVSERFEVSRNFCNKLWNAARFSLRNLEGYEPGAVRDEDLLLEDRWLLSRLATVTDEVTKCLGEYRFADAARTLYSFTWDDFCDYYVEMTKARFSVADGRTTAQRIVAHALDTLLRLLHPMVPFLTEEVWQLLKEVAPERGLSPSPNPSHQGRGTAESVCIAPWPEADRARQDKKIEAQFADFQKVLGAVREIRSRQNIPQKEEITFCVRCDVAMAELLKPMQPYFSQMARATASAMGPKVTAPDLSASVTLPGCEVHVDVSGFIDVGAERQRLEKQREELTKYVTSLQQKLANKNFVDRAPAGVVQEQRDKLAEVEGQLASVAMALGKL